MGEIDRVAELVEFADLIGWRVCGIVRAPGQTVLSSHGRETGSHIVGWGYGPHCSRVAMRAAVEVARS